MKGLVKSLFNNEMLPSVRSVPAGAMSLTACRRGLMFVVAGEGTGRDDGLLLSASRRYAAPGPVARCLFLSDLGGRRSGEDREHAVQGGDEGVDLLAGVVDGKRGADRSRNSEPLHQRLGAVVAGAYGHSHAVEKQSEVVVVYVADVERDHRRFAGCCAVYLQPLDLPESAGGVLKKFMLMAGDVLQSDAFDEVECRSKCGNAHEIGRAGLEPEGEVGEGGVPERYVSDHLPAALIGRHLLKDAPASV